MSTYIETLKRGNDEIAPRTKIEAVENLQTVLDAKEDITNKVTSISASSTDTQYPSAKATYEAVESAKDIFWCTYGTTTIEEIINARDNGKQPVCLRSMTLYRGVALNRNMCVFSANAQDLTYTLVVTKIDGQTTWTDQGSISFENSSNKVPSISSTSTDTQYPSAKCVYNTTEDIREVAAGKTKNYVADLSSNPAFNTQAETVSISTFITIDSVVHQASELRVGDNIYITDTGVPDRWCGAINSGTATMYKLETAKVPVNAVEVNSTSVVDATGKASISVPYETIDANTNARHTHSNYDIINSITQDDITKWNTSDIFECTTSTTYDEITAALTAHKLPVFVSGAVRAVYKKGIADGYAFVALWPDMHMQIKTVNSDNVWSGQILNVENENNKIREISSISTDTEYPSAKAVYNYANNAATKAHFHSNKAVLDTIISSIQTRNITITEDTIVPSGGSDGDIWLRYKA